MYYTYMLRCSDNSIYTGIKNNDIREELKTFSRNNRVLSVVGG